MAKKPKFKRFELTLTDGSTVVAKAPQGKLTEEYAVHVAYHWAGVPKASVTNIRGIE